jgi:uncharacterized protein (DUF1501 family)
MPVSRRSLLRGASLTTMLASLPPGLCLSFAGSANAASAGHVIIFCLLRGGLDGLNLVAPADDGNLIAARPSDLLLSTSGSSQAFRLNNGPTQNDWRLHPSAVELKALYDAGSLAFVHATGVPANSRSHFEMQGLVERGVADPTLANDGTGWIGRYAQKASFGSGTFAVASAEAMLPASMYGDPPAISLPDPKRFVLGSDARTKFLTADYQSAPGLVGSQARTTIAAVQALAQADANYKGSGSYDNNPFAAGLSVIAELIKLDIGLQIAEIEYNIWDTHVNQKPRFTSGVTVLSKSIGEFANDIAAQWGKVTMIVMSEFGRRVKSNADIGTDHGHGNVMIVLGGRVNGGRIYGQWPGLDPAVLDYGDVPVTIDSRAILAEAIKVLRGDLPADLFPNLAASSPLGLFS